MPHKSHLLQSPHTHAAPHHRCAPPCRLVAGVVSAGDLPTAVALAQQEIRVIRSYDPEGESMPVLLMACGYAMEASKLMVGREEEREGLGGWCLLKGGHQGSPSARS